MPGASTSKRHSVTVKSVLRQQETPFSPTSRRRPLEPDDEQVHFSLVRDYSATRTTALASESEKKSALKAKSLREMKAEHKHYSRNHRAAIEKEFDRTITEPKLFTVQEVQEQAKQDYMSTLAPPPPPPLPTSLGSVSPSTMPPATPRRQSTR